MGASTYGRVWRGACVVIVGLVLAASRPDRTDAQAGPMRWDGALEHVTAAGGWWGNPPGPMRLSRHPVSHDGRWIVFGADVPNDPYPSTPQIFRRDRMTGQTEMVVGAQIDQPPVVSGDGNHIAFKTCESWWRPDSANICDVYVIDFRNWSLVNASTAVDGTLSTDASEDPVLSGDGRFLLFRTISPTLLPAGAAPGQIVLRDRDADGNGIYDEPGGVTIEVVSVSSAGEAADGANESAEVSADGRFVAFRSLASNLVPGDTNNAWDVFLHDRQTLETRRINVGWDGQQATPTLDAPAISMSASGDLIAFAADDDYLTNPPTNQSDTNNGLDVLVYDRTANTLTRVDIGINGEQGNGHTYWPTLSADARYLSMLSTSTNAGSPTTPGRTHAYVYDRVTSYATRVSLTPNGDEPNANVSNPLISGDGSFVLFMSTATNLVGTATSGVDAIFGAAHFDLPVATLTISGKGGTATATIEAQQYVQWSGELSEYTWLQWETPPWGKGNGTIAVRAYENPNPTPRSVTITVNAKTIVVTQEPGLSMQAISPASGPDTGGTPVTITGTGFEPGITLFFDGLETPAEFVDSTTLRAITPAHPTGLIYVWLRTSDFRFAMLYPDQFRYVDTTPPQIMSGVSGDLSETGWYRSDVTVDWFVWDPESQILSSTGCARVELKTDTGGTTYTCTATSEGGTTSVSRTVRRDVTPPVITIFTPGPTLYEPSPARTVSLECSDATSGLASCIADRASGQPLDMTPGFHNFGVGASDAAGNPAYKMVTYAVSMGICVPRPAGLAAWWPFETSSGQTTMSSYKDIVSGMDATGVNTANRFGQGVVGAFAMSTANVPSYVNAGTRSALAITGSSMTLSAWIFPTVDYDPNGAVIAGREGEYLLARFPDGTLRFSVANTNPGWGWVNTYHVIPRWLWSQVTLTYNGSTVLVYVNGEVVYGALATGAIGDAEPTLNEFRIGARQKPATPSYFVGGIDDVQLLNRALSSDEVQNMFLAGNNGLCGPRNLQLTMTPSPVRITYGTTQQVELVASLMDDGVPVVGRPVTLTKWGQTLVAGVTDDAGQVRTTTSVTGVGAGTSYGAYQADHPASFYYAQSHVFVDQITDKAVPQISWPSSAPITYGTALGAGQLNATANTGGTFTYTPAAGTVLPAGAQTLNVSFQPFITANYTNASATVTLDVTQATPSIQVTGGTFTYDGAAHSATATATGATGSPLTPVTITYNGSAQAPIDAGVYTVVASYAGDANHAAGSASTTLTIDKATPTVSATGGTFTYDATAHGATASATGIGGEALSPVTFTYNGSSDAPVNAGSYDVVASYAGSANYHAASGTATLTIDKATPTVSATGGTFTYDATTHSATASATGVGGEALSPVTFTYNGSSDAPVNAGSYDVVASYAGSANYHAASGTATLTITKATPTVTAVGGTFTYDGAAHAASASASGVGGETLAPVTLTYDGSASVPVNAGMYAVVASFSGSANYNGASATATLTIGRAAAVLQWSAPGSIVYGTPLGAAQLNATASTGGTFTYTPALGVVLAAGSGHPLSATFSPADTVNYNGGSIATTITVVPAPLTLRANDAAKPFGAPLPGFTVSATGLVNGDSLATLTGTLSLATTAIQESAVGSYPIVPSGLSSANYAITFVSGTLSVVPGTVAVGVSTMPEPSGMNQPMTFTATVAPVAPAAGMPGGNVRFFDGSRLLGTAVLSAGTASLSTAGLDPGTRLIQAQYEGDGSFAPGTGSASHVVNDASGTPVLTITSSRNPSTNGQSVTLTANVSMTGGPVSGTVQCYSGGALLGSGTIAAGRATFTTTTLSPGSHAITALYTGSASAPPSRSAVFVQAVGPTSWKNRNTTMTLSSSLNPSGLGEAVVFTARVTGATSSMPTGRILLMVDGSVVGDPSGIVVSPVSGSTAQVTLSLTNLMGGRHNVTATYLGDSNYKGSTAALAQQVN